MKTTKLFCLMTLAVTVASCPQLAAQVQTDVPQAVSGAKPVSVEHIKVHGTSLKGNLEGDAVDRDVFVFLPPSYVKQKSRRYPVVYALHGYSIGAEQWTHEIHVPQTIEGAFAQGAQEVISSCFLIRRRCTTAPCIRARSRREISSNSSHTTLLPTSMRITGRFRTGLAAAWWATRWEATARPASASNIPMCSAVCTS